MRVVLACLLLVCVFSESISSSVGLPSPKYIRALDVTNKNSQPVQTIVGFNSGSLQYYVIQPNQEGYI